MKLIICLLAMFMPLLFSCVNSNNESNAVETQTVDVSEKPAVDSTKIITAEEFIVFWNKFSEAFLQNDTLTLSDLIADEIVNGGGLFFTGVSEITAMNFKDDTIISKSQFLTEFKHSLNPVYLRLLKKYNVREDIETPNYHCDESVKNYDYAVETYYDNEYNTVVAFDMSYDIEDEPDENMGARGMIFVFRKTNGEIKLGKIYYAVNETYE